MTSEYVDPASEWAARAGDESRRRELKRAARPGVVTLCHQELRSIGHLDYIISLPDISRQNATFFPGPQIAPVGIPDPTFSFRSDLWYVPTIRTFLLYQCFFYSEVPGAEAPN